MRNHGSLLPLIVVGSLRAGGAGKTPVALELARTLSRDRRVGILVYRIGKKPVQKKGAGADFEEVTPQSDWRFSSDEAVLLARALEVSGVRIFATRNRERAWKALSEKGELDLLVSDDGIMDPRLDSAFRILLRQPGENPRWFDLLPAGPYHLTLRILKKVDCILEGPQPSEEESDFGFRRELIFPANFDFDCAYWVLCGLGNPEAFHRDLLNAGVRVTGVSAGRDHKLPERGRARALAKQKGARLVCTSKDAVKLNEAALAETVVIGERMSLGKSLLFEVNRYLDSRPSS